VPVEDRHVLFAKATEFGSFIGQNSLDLTRFLIKVWDGEDYQYKLRNSKDVLHEPLLSLLGGTTPTDIASLLPPEAIGQGFMSRCVLVYAPNKEKSVPPSRFKLDRKHEKYLTEVYRWIWQEARGPVTLTKEASELLDVLYETELKMQDNRFIFYTERRSTHLQKTAMALALADKRMEIYKQDIEEAHRILTAAEVRMPDALGEYGLSPLAVARQKMLEYLRYAKEPVSERVLWAVMQKDMKLVDFQNSIAALVNARKISAVDTENGRALLYNDKVTQLVSTMDEETLDALFESTPKEDDSDDGQHKVH